jgi:hypothetical protein
MCPIRVFFSVVTQVLRALFILLVCFSLGTASALSGTDRAVICLDVLGPKSQPHAPISQTSWWDGFQDIGLNDYARCLISYDGDLIVGGWFTEVGEVSTRRIASWDGTHWTQLGEGLNGTVYSLVVYEGNLVAGGWFTQSGTADVNNIARWDGTDWHPLADGVDGSVLALAVYDGRLIAGGMFRQAGGVPADFVAAWDGGSWMPLGAGMDRPVRALCVYDGVLVAGGAFAEADSNSVGYIAAWDGGSWGNVAGGMDDWVEALAVFNGELIAGGAFGRAGGITVEHIARWDGQSWKELGDGMNDQVFAFGSYQGDLIAGGNFSQVGDRVVNRIARWNGEYWRQLGSGLGPSPGAAVYALQDFRGSLYAGGKFTTAGENLSENIARWDDTPPNLSLAVFQNPYLSQYLDICLLSSEALDPETVTLTVCQEEMHLQLLDPQENVWAADFRLESTEDTVEIESCARDLLGNLGCTTSIFSASLIAADLGGIAVSTDKKVSLTIGPGALPRDTYILIGACSDGGLPGIHIDSSMPQATGSASTPNAGDVIIAYSISPEPVILAAEACIKFSYGEYGIEAPIAAHQLYIENSTAGRLDCIVDPGTEVLYARTKCLGTFSLAAGLPHTTPQVEPGFLIIDPPYPTPSIGDVNIRFRVRAPEHVVVTIYDTEGHAVAKLLDGDVYPGAEVVSWNGMASRGVVAAPGIYYCEVRGPRGSLTCKIVLVR